MNTKKICTACGTQFPMNVTLELCPICTDDRQAVLDKGQTWTNLTELTERFGVITKQIADGLCEIKMVPYPNRIPLPLQEIWRIKAQMMQLEFDTMYGFYDYQNVHGNAKTLLEKSLNCYI